MKIKEKTIYTLIQDEIPLHEESVKYLEVLNDYKYINELPNTFKSPIIHLYAKEDTYNEYGELNGYKDALFFECHIFEPETKTAYKSKRLHDTVRFHEVSPSDVRIFKDGSTLIGLHGDIEIELYQSVHVNEVKNK